MNTFVRQDFAEFLEFLKLFSLRNVANEPGSMAEMRKAHAQFLALVTAVAELISSDSPLEVEFSNSYGEVGKKYLSEVVSDSSEFVLNVAAGLCRSAGGTLRSAIESYLKALAANEQPLILQRTSVPDVFRDASGVSFFRSAIGRDVVSQLKQVYGALNAYVHTVSDAHMFGALAVGGFPRWSERNERLVELFVKVARLFLFGIVGSRRDLYDRFDYRNKVVVTRSLTRLQRRSALGVDG